jgi:endoglucanase
VSRLGLCAALLAFLTVLAAAGAARGEPQASLEAFPARLLNIGNALEAPSEGAWGVVIEEWFFDVIRDGGFDGIRLPVRWSAHALAGPPYTIDPAFLSRIDEVLDQASARDLAVILNIHHFDELNADPAGQRDRFLALWSQIAAHYAARPSGIVFELLNEPGLPLTSGWNALLADAIAAIRPTNPARIIVVGPALFNIHPALPALVLPDDPNLLVTFHYYFPLQFTHQGAGWVPGSDAWLGTTWGSEANRAAVVADFDSVTAWAAANDRKILLGEFGAIDLVDLASRTAYIDFVRQQAELRGWPWAHWQFVSNFPVYDLDQAEWIEPVHRALIPQVVPIPVLPGWGAALLAGLLAATGSAWTARHRRVRSARGRMRTSLYLPTHQTPPCRRGERAWSPTTGSSSTTTPIACIDLRHRPF